MRIYSTEFILPILLGTQGYSTQGYFTRLFNRLCYPEFILRAQSSSVSRLTETAVRKAPDHNTLE